MTSYVSTRRRGHPGRWLAIAMTAALMATACGTDDTPADGPVTVNVLIPDSSSNIVDPAYKVLNPEFTKRTGTSVTFVKSGGDYGAVEERILAARIAGNLPDAAIISSASIRTYVDAKLAQPFDSLMKADTSYDPTTAEPSLLKFGARDGKTYALPLTASWVVMYYNTEIFKKAGLNPDDPPETLTELGAAARKIVDSGAAKHGLAFRLSDDPNMWRLQNVVASGGGSLMNDDESEPTFDDPALLGLVRFLADLAKDGVIAHYDAESMSEAYYRGDVGIVYDASSGARTHAKSANFDYRIAPYPIPDGGRRILSAGGASIVMFTDDPVRQQAVWEAVRELVGPAGGAAYLEEQGGGVLVLDAAANKSKAKEHAELALKPEDVADFAPMVQFPGRSAQEIWTILGEQILAVLQSGKDPATALADAEAAAKPLLP
ncbi:ABC transporter substrate-binding protein [Acrocarpospora macrocephala]|uniref:ABC transporter substrate-binding protein n=1 Tax=Acrocarpospora macrocephala TaxID=150177 RepID=A0A5M3X183_9ACTN|nr:extracellular solute-binding protein [Acrocarpospora macrocephala]GES14436.1 ABC transporter substrate-binding protein [Acrocarpospora macrocephala]